VPSVVVLATLTAVALAVILFMGNWLAPSQTMATPIVNATTKHTATVIFLHGLGDTGHGWSQLFHQIRLPYVRYVCPSAKVMPVTLNGGMRMSSWFDIRGLAPGSSEDEQGIREAAEFLQSLIAEEEKKGIDRSRIIVGGFSQGGAVALYSSFTTPQKSLAGIVALSTWLPLYKTFPACVKANQATPILQCHGEDDMLVASSFGMMTSHLIKSFNSKLVFKTYPGMGHSSCDEEMEEVKKFISECLPPV
jgi:lysophospholipase-2